MQLDGAVAAAAVPGPPGGRTPSAMLDEMFSTATEPPRRDRTGEWRGIDLDR